MSANNTRVSRRNFIVAAAATSTFCATEGEQAFAGPILTEKTPAHEADPLVGWLAKWQAARIRWLNACMSKEECSDEDTHWAEMEKFELLISRTPAKTLEGIEAKLIWMTQDCDGEYVYPEYQTTHQSILESLTAIQQGGGS